MKTFIFASIFVIASCFTVVSYAQQNPGSKSKSSMTKSKKDSVKHKGSGSGSGSHQGMSSKNKKTTK
jgi:hypothetical protein